MHTDLKLNAAKMARDLPLTPALSSMERKNFGACAEIH
jgi:hypothetical protein